jgi:hypothetical protein
MEEVARSADTQGKRQIKNFLIDKHFQLGWVFKVAVAASVVVGGMGYFLYATLSESVALMTGEALVAEGMSPVAQQAIIARGEHDKFMALMIIIATAVGLVLLLSLMTIVVTHKVAGPIYKMKRLFHGITGDRLQLFEQLRRGDELHDVFKEFDNMLRRLRESRHVDVEKIEAVVKSCEEKGLAGAQLKPLREIVKKYKASVKMDNF